MECKSFLSDFLYYTFCSTNYMYLNFFPILNFDYFIKKVKKKKNVTRNKKIFVFVYTYSTPCPLRALFFPRHTTFFNMNKRQNPFLLFEYFFLKEKTKNIALK